MVEKNLICPSCRDEDMFFKQSNVSWEDLRGLTWLFCEECTHESHDEGLKSISVA